MRHLFLKTGGGGGVLFPAAKLALTSNTFLSQRPCFSHSVYKEGRGLLGHQGGGPQGQGPFPSLMHPQWLAGLKIKQEQGSRRGSWWAWGANPWLASDGSSKGG